MAKKGNFLQTHKGAVFLNVVYSVGASVVILGALFKLQHWAGANEMLIAGLGTEAVIFAIQALAPPKEELDWSRVYPELEDDSLSASGDGSGQKDSLTRKLDDMLEEANIERDMISRLGDNLGKLNENVEKMGQMGDAAAATGELSANAREAANTLGQLKDAYSTAISSAEGLGTSLEGMKGISEETAKVQGEMTALQENLSGLNRLYGNMLTAIKS